MRIVLFVHGDFLPSKSMPRFANMIFEAMTERGHEVSFLQPKPFFLKLSSNAALKKYLGYIDQFIIFPFTIKKKLKTLGKDALFVFTDNALGPWVPYAKKRHHVIHCHDFLAQRSAFSGIPENPLSTSGKLYQRYIRNGYRQGKNFISVSKKTQQDLHVLLGRIPSFSEVVYNGLNNKFSPLVSFDETGLSPERKAVIEHGFILHVGGNQWYKNRAGVIEIYNNWRSASSKKLALMLIGATPSEKLLKAFDASPFKQDIHFITDAADDFVRYAYTKASVFLFPSLAEGFGWPIAEAMASGCVTITTNEAPMKEVSGNAGFLIERRPFAGEAVGVWQQQSALALENVLNLSEQQKNEAVEAGIKNAMRFDAKTAMDAIENLYKSVLKINCE